MATMVMDTAPSKSIIALTIISAISFSAVAGEIEFTPNMIVTETYTDNIDLTRTNEESSLVSQLGVGLNFNYVAQQLQFRWASESTYATYTHDHDLDKDYHNLASSLSWVIWPKGIRFIADSNISNKSKSNGTNSLADIVSADTVRIETYRAGFAYDVKNSDFIINSQIAYVASISEDEIGERDGIQAQLDTRNGKGADNIFWEADGKYQDLENNANDATFYRAEVKLGWISNYSINPLIRYYDEDNQGSVSRNRALESNSIGVGLRWLITPRFYVEASYNDPIGNKTDLDGNELKAYYDINLNWQPTTRTSIRANKTERFFGDSYSLNIRHRSKRMENSISYIEDVQVFTRNNLEPYLEGLYWCPQGDSSVLENCYITDGQNINFDDYTLVTVTNFNVLEDQEYNLNKMLEWTSSLKLPRTTFDLTLSQNKRTNLNKDLVDIYGRGVFAIQRKVSGRSSLSLQMEYSDNVFHEDEVDERQDRYRRYTLSYKKRLNSQLNIDFGISVLNRDSDLSLFNYTENRVHFKFTKEF